ncbi:MAG: class I SAM-dependent RNA methyltransferase, partial [Candidatus Sericytochromatia bacterium]|nr:class I SAM-dependent RNA methyltransferase [Candidatus Sericytochromatia bacterium]
AGLVQLSRWHPDRMLVDPCCGTGTIPIEAAMIGLNMAPGRNRRFASSDWPQVPAAIWAQACEEADSLARKDRELRIYGSDMDGQVLKLARFAAEQAGLTGKIFFEKKELKDFRSQIKYGYMITNPPYGERLGQDRHSAEKLYKEMGAKYTELIGWGCYVMTAHQDFETFFNWKAEKKRKLYNGNMRCDLFQYKAQRPPKRDDEAEPDVETTDDSVLEDTQD